MPPAVANLSVALDGGSVHTLRAGVPGPRAPLVLVHGGGTDATALSWFRALPALATDREVWALDLPGVGATTDPRARTPEAMADLVAVSVTGWCRWRGRSAVQRCRRRGCRTSVTGRSWRPRTVSWSRSGAS